MCLNVKCHSHCNLMRWNQHEIQPQVFCCNVISVNDPYTNPPFSVALSLLCISTHKQKICSRWMLPLKEYFCTFSFHVVVFLCQLAGLVQIITNLAASFYISTEGCGCFLWHLQQFVRHVKRAFNKKWSIQIKKKEILFPTEIFWLTWLLWLDNRVCCCLDSQLKHVSYFNFFRNTRMKSFS